MKRLIILIPFLIIILFIGFLVFQNNSNISIQKNLIRVTSAENVYGNIVAQIGGQYVSVYSILKNPEQDPHAYDPSVQDAREVVSSQIVIQNGAGYDDFMSKLLVTKNASQKVINIAENEHITINDNPHIWYNLQIMQNTARVIALQLEQIDPVHGVYYNTQLRSVESSLQSLQLREGEIIPIASGKSIIATERVADYLLQACGFTITPNVFQKAVEEGNDPSADSISYFQNILSSKQVNILVYNTQTTSTITEKMKQIAISNKIPVIGVEETLPATMSYQAWISSKLDKIQIVLNSF